MSCLRDITLGMGGKRWRALLLGMAVAGAALPALAGTGNGSKATAPKAAPGTSAPAKPEPEPKQPGEPKTPTEPKKQAEPKKPAEPKKQTEPKKQAEPKEPGEPKTPDDSGTPVIEAVTYASDRGELFVPVRELADALGSPAVWDKKKSRYVFLGKTLPSRSVRRLPDGTRMAPVSALKGLGAAVEWDGKSETATVEASGKRAVVRRVPKRVAVNLRTQRLRAWEGRRLVFETHISSGRPGHATPRGNFRTGPLKAAMVISHKYNDAKMPWAVQVQGDVMIHGAPSVPRRPASHGCVRVPLSGYNPAHWFYRWVPVGVPVRIANDWPKDPAPQ